MEPLVFNAETCPDPLATATAYHTKITDALNRMQALVCDVNDESIGRDNEAIVALTALRDSFNAAINNATSAINADSDQLAALNTLFTDNAAAITILGDAVEAARTANEAAAQTSLDAANANATNIAANAVQITANETQVAANVAQIATNEAIQDTLQELANALRTDLAALVTRVDTVDGLVATQGSKIGDAEANISTLQTQRADLETRLADIEQNPQAQVDLSAITEKNVEQDASLADLIARMVVREGSTDALDAVCAFLKRDEEVKALLPAFSDYVCVPAVPAGTFPSMAFVPATSDSGATEL